MNYLIHLFLAEENDDDLIGNLLGDFVSGRPDETRYNPAIVRGIFFHRKIDIFSDAHHITKLSRSLFSKQRRRFAGIIVDVCCDHFISRHWQQFTKRNRKNFIRRVYDVLTQYHHMLPHRLQAIRPYIIDEDWLGNYIHLQSLGTTLDRIAGRLSRGEQFKGALIEVEAHYDALERNFLNFFPDLVHYTRELRRSAAFSG